MKKAVLTVGVSASGKTTWAEEFVTLQNSTTSESDPELFPQWVNINRDDIRFYILGERNWTKWNWKWEKQVTAVVDQQILEAVNEGKNIIISDTNLNSKYRNQLKEKLECAGYVVELKVFDISYEEAVKRDALRANGVGSSVIAKQMEQYQEFLWENGAYKHEHNPSLPWCVIFDIDGTLAHMKGRGAFDWHRVGEDDLDLSVYSIVCGVHQEVSKTFVFSGRDSVCRKETIEWLDYHFVPYDSLVMRTQGDMRKDTIVKEEMFNKHVKDKYNVLFVVDDRPSVCRMWRSLGLKVLQVDNPYIEF